MAESEVTAGSELPVGTQFTTEPTSSSGGAVAPDLTQPLLSLDGLRGIAILLVLVDHFSGGASLALPRWLSALTQVGFVGVDLFFVLSGFLITGILVDTRGESGYFTKFYARRSLRIFPLYYAVLIAVFGGLGLLGFGERSNYAVMWDAQWQFWTYLTNVVQAVDGTRTTAVNWLHLSHFWSLAVEEQFYLLWPLCVWLTPRRHLVPFCWAVVCGALVLRLGLWHWEVRPRYSYLLMPCRADALAFGALIALGLRQPGVAHARLRRGAARVLLGTSLVVAAFFAWRGRLYFLDPWVRTLGYSVIAFGWAALILWVLTTPLTASVNRWLQVPWLRATGKYSYGAYVYHNLVMGIAFRLARPQVWEDKLGWFPAWLGALAVPSVITAVIAVLSYRLFEQRFLALKRYFEYERR